eukprot:CAMPEP_0172913184 /NCGR_PEP_ID=MMETSP1075-20121228/189890_1 /TAXON_ID=2916 /ORGANISM="Ceratium fusus, Strain PA161109" /LENGTH=191 /DNA_ID=CAMNT_0013771839 /DNA_START=210 /DNA_END=785 /DNA_ORIENTATION=+
MQDPDLAPRGEEQALTLRSHPALQCTDRRPEVLLVSPLRRSLRTAAVAFLDPQPNLPCLVDPDLFSSSGDACDKTVLKLGLALLGDDLGRPHLAGQLEALDVDALTRRGAYAPGTRLLHARLRRLSDQLRDRPERCFLMVADADVLAACAGAQTSLWHDGVVAFALTPRGVWRALPPADAWPPGEGTCSGN